MAKYTEEWIANGNTKFYTRIYSVPNPKAAVVFIHGFIEHIGRFDHVISRFADAGVSALGFDQRGYGRTALDAENQSPSSAYGKTSRTEQLADIEFFLNEAKKRFGTDRLFLYGHSMGGALVLSYPCIGPNKTGIKSCLKGVLSTSPLIRTTHPPPAWKRMLGWAASKLRPWMLIPAPVSFDKLSHDPVSNKAYQDDPLVIEKSSLLALDTMLGGGEDLEDNHYRQWPQSLPLWLIHGDADEVTSFRSSDRVFKALKADDKTWELYKGGFHELHNEPDFKDGLITKAVEWTLEHIDIASQAGPSVIQTLPDGTQPNSGTDKPKL